MSSQQPLLQSSSNFYISIRPSLQPDCMEPDPIVIHVAYALHHLHVCLGDHYQQSFIPPQHPDPGHTACWIQPIGPRTLCKTNLLAKLDPVIVHVLRPDRNVTGTGCFLSSGCLSNLKERKQFIEEYPRPFWDLQTPWNWSMLLLNSWKSWLWISQYAWLSGSKGVKRVEAKPG